MQPVERPLSPHLQIYRLPMLALLSITHRATGVALSAATVLLVYWLMALAAGPESYATAQSIFGSVPGLLVLFGLSWALFYHLCNGIRHLAWDIGYGLEVETADATGWMVVIASVVMTLVTWTLAFMMGGFA
ncbi:MAG: succinate dehydrogenase, cytochrome b556 subunit [Pseudomonadota bacterium]